jgi:hypothetical protein
MTKAVLLEEMKKIRVVFRRLEVHRGMPLLQNSSRLWTPIIVSATSFLQHVRQHFTTKLIVAEFYSAFYRQSSVPITHAGPRFTKLQTCYNLHMFHYY